MNKQNNRGHGKDKTQNSPSRPITAVELKEWEEIIIIYAIYLFFQSQFTVLIVSIQTLIT